MKAPQIVYPNILKMSRLISLINTGSNELSIATALVNRRWYDLCVMWELRNALRSGRIWVEHSKRYTHLDSYLMPKETWQTKKPVFFELVAIESKMGRSSKNASSTT